jgi:predicted DNA-binding transcriptional regulator AlpA
MTTQQQAPLLLDSHAAGELLAVSRRKFWELVKRPDFPRPRKLGERTQRWMRGEIEAWAAALPEERVDEPEPLTAARKAKLAGLPTAHAPFPAASNSTKPNLQARDGA